MVNTTWKVRDPEDRFLGSLPLYEPVAEYNILEACEAIKTEWEALGSSSMLSQESPLEKVLHLLGFGLHLILRHTKQTDLQASPAILADTWALLRVCVEVLNRTYESPYADEETKRMYENICYSFIPRLTPFIGSILSDFVTTGPSPVCHYPTMIFGQIYL